MVWGFHPVREALRNRPHAVAELRILGRLDSKRSEELAQLARRHRVPVKRPTDEPARSERYAALLCASGPPAQPSDPELVVLLEDLQDPRNLGAVLRVCEGAGVGRVLIRDRGSAPISPTVVKAAAGATEWLQIERYTNTIQELERLRKEGFWLFGCDAAGEPPWSCDLSGPVVLCFGGEHRGLRARTRKACDVMVGLPMRGQISSLNVSTAAAAVLYESVRQRQR